MHMFMSMRRFISGLGVLTLSMVVLSGCEQAPPVGQNPEEVIREGFVNLVDVTAYSFEAEVNGDITDATGGDVKFDVMMDGAIDVTNAADPKIMVAMKVNADGADGGGSAEGEAKVNKESVYFNLMKLDLKTEGGVPDQMQEFVNKWWSIALPEGTFDQLTEGVPTAVSEEERAALKKALAETSFFTQPQFVGTENVMGESSYRYAVTFDKKAFVDFTKKVAQEQGEQVSEADMQQALDELENVEIKGDIWVGVDSKTIHQFKGELVSKDPQAPGTVLIRVTIGDFNKPVTLTLPTDAAEFPLADLLGPFFMPQTVPDIPDMESLTPEQIEAMSTQIEGAAATAGSATGTLTPEQLQQLEAMGVQ